MAERMLPRELAEYYIHQCDYHRDLFRAGHYIVKCGQTPGVLCHFSGLIDPKGWCIVQNVFNDLLFCNEEDNCYGEPPSRPVPLKGDIEEKIVWTEADALVREIRKFFPGFVGGSMEFCIMEPTPTLKIGFCYTEEGTTIHVLWEYKYKMDTVYEIREEEKKRIEEIMSSFLSD